MIDQVYQVLKTIVNKELRGNVSPAEFNLLAEQTQLRIFREYFEEAARDKLRKDRGMLARNYANLPYYQRQRIEKFADQDVLTRVTIIQGSSYYLLPSDLYFIKDNGITLNGKVVEETQPNEEPYKAGSIAASSTVFPTMEILSDRIILTPNDISSDLVIRYLREPRAPKWTYTEVGGSPLYDPAQVDFQDFELHTSEFPNIVITMLSYWGINLREGEVTQYAEALKQKQEIKEEN